MAATARPSDARRQALSQSLSVPQVSNFFPIERYYDAADKVHESFQEAFAKEALDEAYVYGKRYCSFCIDAIPEHNYYMLVKYRQQKIKHEKQVDQVIRQLGMIVEQMDRQEQERQVRLEQEQIRKYQEIQARIELQKQQSSQQSANIQESALQKLSMLRIKRDPSGDEPLPQLEDMVPLPPPPSIDSLPPPPAYHQVVVQPPSPRMSMYQLQQLYQQDYIKQQQSGHIQVRGLPTYQGRVDASTNGCTVISALVAATHLQVDPLQDNHVVHIIDIQCGPILRQIRSKLGLGGHALIVPSDVHDHLVDAKLLKQEHFCGVAGGNCMDEKHMGEFTKLLAVGENGQGTQRKAAATFFFREHVVSIVKTVMNDNKVVYDLVDSLPTLQNGSSLMATRTRCHSLEALHALLRWYTSRKFAETHCKYIDRSAWDDSMADFDPRVFQGFVWMV